MDLRLPRMSAIRNLCHFPRTTYRLIQLDNKVCVFVSIVNITTRAFRLEKLAQLPVTFLLKY